MTKITIETEDKTALIAVKALLHGLGVPYSESHSHTDSSYDPEFVKKVKAAESRVEEGDFITVDPENLWGSIESGLKDKPQKN
jgi:isopropylmalate/homocitrate/citramalate synthase